MRSFVTSYNDLFAHRSESVPTVTHIEIPLIQRDYAQGREGAAVGQIRENFLDVLYRAVALGESVSLDFIYGDVENGTLRPLDGQQRLTTLFLLHWYLACRAERLDESQAWKQFTYATRPSARLFCQRLVESQPPVDVERPSTWIEDQPWYLYTWRHDPTIQSMLVMLDAIHERFLDANCAAAWESLIDPDSPSISFHLLPIEQMGLSEDLYIKMNSRGKPLTPFENFKARFEKTLETSCPDRVRSFALKVDGEWADLLWPYHGGDFIVDDEFLCYLEFVTELCEWREGRVESGRLGPRAERVFGSGNSNAAEHLDFLFRSFDTWVGDDIASTFDGFLATTTSPVNSEKPTKVVLFGQQAGLGTNLFLACCHNYGSLRGRNRVFGLPHSLLLYAVLLHRMKNTPDFVRRLRIVRNLIEASGNELRLGRMPALIADVERIVVDGTLEGVSAFNQAQVADERLKATMLEEHPELESVVFHLEDHPILRGSLAAFEIDIQTLERRAAAFHRLFSDASCWPALTGALLATGDYARQLNYRVFQFGSGSNEAPWLELLTGAARSNLKNTRETLGQLLDHVAESQVELDQCLEEVRSTWLQRRRDAGEFDWRFYFVKYDAMREGNSGIYVAATGTIGYSVCMLNKRQMNSWHRDPYLLAIWRESGVGEAVKDPWFLGYVPRRLRLERSGTELECVENGIAIRPPSGEEQTAAFAEVCQRHGVGEDHVLKVPQEIRGDHAVDVKDRVQVGASLLRDLVLAGL